MSNIINLDSRRKPTSFTVTGRSHDGSLPQMSTHDPKFVQEQALGQFMMSEVEKGSLVSFSQLAQVQAGVASFFGCKGVFVGINTTETGTEILCIPAHKSTKNTWHILSWWDFFWATRKQEVLNNKNYKLEQYLDIVSKHVKLPRNYTIRVLRKPTQELWDQFRAKNNIK